MSFSIPAAARTPTAARTVAGALISLVLVGCGAGSNEPTYVRQRPIESSPLLGNLGGVTAKNASTAGRASRDGDGAGGADKSIGFVAAALGATAAEEARGSCRPGMVSIDGRYCIDKYEASLVEVVGAGDERPFSPFTSVADQHVRAVSEPHVYPQGYISAVQAERACSASGKRLCKVSEWQQACRGPEKKQYGYSEQREVGRCNDNGKNPVMTLFGPRYDASTMNKPQLNQLAGTLSKTGDHTGCSNDYGVYDMVGNLHEWVADPDGSFYGGYYQDVASVGHGDGCNYRTTAHEARYHDYSTGFRCCADALGSESAVTVSPAVAPTGAVKAPSAKPAGKRYGPKRRK